MLKRLTAFLNVAFVLGVCILCSLATLWLDTFFFLNRAQPATGIVIGTRQLRGGTPIPTIRFQTTSGQTIEVEPDNPFQHRYEEGSEVAILYDPATPQEALLHEYRLWGLWLPPLLVAPIGLILTALGLSQARKQRAPSPA